MMETWKDIPGYEGLYQVSDAGRVASVDRVIVQVSRHGTPFHRKLAGKLLRPGRMAQGHVSVVLTRAHGSATVHSLVMLAFVGPPTPGQEIRHLDGNPGNNRLGNLTYGTRGENLIDRAYHGQRKLSVDQVREIRASTASAETTAVTYGVCENMIRYVRARKQGYYAHVS